MDKKTNLKTILSLFIGFMLMLFLVYGCGYSNKSLVVRNVESIYIPIFENDTFRRGLEFGITKAVKDEIMSKTNLRIVDKDSADTHLTGTLKDVVESVLTRDIRDSIVESRVILIVDIKLVDRRTGRVLVDKRHIRQEAEFIVKRGETVDSAYDEGFVNLAEVIVNSLEEKW